MQYESDAKVAHGLGIATLVLSILGIVVSLALILGVGAVKSVVVEALEPSGNAIESFVETDSDLSQISDVADEFIDWLGEANVKDFEAVAHSVTVKEINGFGKVVLTGDADKVEVALKGIESEYGLDIDAKGMAKSITSLSPNAIKAFGGALSEMDKDDLNDLRSGLSMYDLQYLEDFKNLKQSATNPESQQLVVDGITAVVIAVIVWMIVAYVISLIAAVLTMRNCRKPEQLTGAFIWSIIAAVIGFFSGHFITMILLIIMCVYIAKVRKFRAQFADGAVVQPATPVVEASPVQPTGSAPTPPQE